MRNKIVLRTLIASLIPVLFLLAGCTADGAWDVLRDLTGFPGPGTYTETLIAVKDTSIYDSLSLNYGSCSTLATNQSGGSDLGAGRVLVRFNLFSISPAAIINSAEFKLTKTGGDVGAIDQHIHRLTSSWTEGSGSCMGSPDEANWFDPWATDGGDYDPASITSVNITSDQEYTWAGAPLTTLVEEWNQGLTPNHGLIVGSPDTGTEFRFFASRENSTASNRPKLVINYTIP